MDSAGSAPGQPSAEQRAAESRVVTWWDRCWGALWMIGSAWIAYQTASWFAVNATPVGLGPLRYALVAFAFLFGLLLGMAGLSLIIIGIMVGLERLLAALGQPLRRPAPLPPGAAPVAEASETGEAPGATGIAGARPVKGG